jgi:Tfp pilus assembly protein FimT
MAELFIVISIMAIMTLLAVPRIAKVRDRGGANSAAAEVGAAIESARAAAIQRGRRATVRFRGDSVLAVVDTGPPWLPSSGQMLVLRVANTKQAYGVELTVPANRDVLVYDARGFANPRLVAAGGSTAGATYVLARGAARDSVCLNDLGMILPRGCRL